MKKFIATALLMIVAGMCFAADPVEGFWISTDEKSGKDTAGWEIFVQSGKLFGRILSIAGKPQNEKASKCKAGYKGFPAAGNVSQMTVVGTSWIYGLVLDKQAGQWKDGNIVNPEDGGLYACKITFRAAGTRSGSRTFQADTLEMRGEIGLGIGRSQFWRRVTQEEAAGLR